MLLQRSGEVRFRLGPSVDLAFQEKHQVKRTLFNGAFFSL